jgi:nitroreductase
LKNFDYLCVLIELNYDIIIMENDNYWCNRRTIRRYSDRPIEDALLNDLLLKASHAPTTGNMQLYSVVVSRDADMKRRLAPAHFNQPQVEGSAVVLTFCADFNRFSNWCEQRQAEPCYDNLQSLEAATIDTVAFAQQFNSLAELAGLGVCWLGTTTYNPQEIADALKLPKLVVPIITLTVGYPAEDGAEVGRLPIDAILHNETYQPWTAQRINEAYAEKESRPDSRQFIAENNKQTLAQVFTDLRYPRANNEFFSEKFQSFLVGAGFLKK